MISETSVTSRVYTAIKNGVDTPARLYSLGYQSHPIDELIASGHIRYSDGRYSILKPLQIDSPGSYKQHQTVVNADIEQILSVLNDSNHPLTQAEIQAKTAEEIPRGRFRAAISALEQRGVVLGSKSRKASTGGRVFEYSLKREVSA